MSLDLDRSCRRSPRSPPLTRPSRRASPRGPVRLVASSRRARLAPERRPLLHRLDTHARVRLKQWRGCCTHCCNTSSTIPSASIGQRSSSARCWSPCALSIGSAPGRCLAVRRPCAGEARCRTSGRPLGPMLWWRIGPSSASPLSGDKSELCPRSSGTGALPGPRAGGPA